MAKAETPTKCDYCLNGSIAVVNVGKDNYRDLCLQHFRKFMSYVQPK